MGFASLFLGGAATLTVRAALEKVKSFLPANVVAVLAALSSEAAALDALAPSAQIDEVRLRIARRLEEALDDARRSGNAQALRQAYEGLAIALAWKPRA